MPLMNFLVHSYTCCSDRHASPYWSFISIGFTPSILIKRITEHCSSLVHVASGAAMFTLLLCHHVAFLHLTTTCRPPFKPWVLLLSTYNTIELCFKFLSHFKGFHMTLPCSRTYSNGVKSDCVFHIVTSVHTLGHLTSVAFVCASCISYSTRSKSNTSVMHVTAVLLFCYCK
jgi:hypothetical protein